MKLHIRFLAVVQMAACLSTQDHTHIADPTALCRYNLAPCHAYRRRPRLSQCGTMPVYRYIKVDRCSMSHYLPWFVWFGSDLIIPHHVDVRYKYVTNLGWFGQSHTKSSVWLHGQLLLLKSLVRSLPATLYTFYAILNMLSEWFKPTRSGSMVLSGHGKWLCSYIPRQLGSRTLVAGLWSGRVRGLTRS